MKRYIIEYARGAFDPFRRSVLFQEFLEKREHGSEYVAVVQDEEVIAAKWLYDNLFLRDNFPKCMAQVFDDVKNMVQATKEKFVNLQSLNQQALDEYRLLQSVIELDPVADLMWTGEIETT